MITTSQPRLDATTKSDDPLSETRPPSADAPATRTKPILVLGANGKTGRRVVARLTERGLPLRLGSRKADPPFDWTDRSTWDAALAGVGALYLSYVPDLAVPGAVEAVDALTGAAVDHGVEQIVLLSGRGEDEAQRAERVVQGSGLTWTIVRSSWFNQNFSEGYMLDGVLAGEVVLPAASIPEPFVDTDDIADVAVAALSKPGHADQIYEVTGPRPLTFAEAIATIGEATSREIRYAPLPVGDYAAMLAEAGLPDDVIWLITYLFTTVLDGRNATVTDGVQRALGRPPKDFADFARETAARGVWTPSVRSAGR